MKQMVDISEKLITEQSDEIFGVSQISWENSPWKLLSLVNDEEVISLSHAKVYVFSDSILCLGKVNQNPTSNTVWEQQLGWFKDSSQNRTEHQILSGKTSWVGSNIHHKTELWTQLTENRWNSSGIFFQDSLHCSSSKKSKSSWTKWATQNNSKDEWSSCRCSMTSDKDLKDNEQECIANSTLVSVFAKRFPAGHWSFLGPGPETKVVFH